MDIKDRWTRESLDNAFQQASSEDPSAVLLDSFGRRVFRFQGNVIKYGTPVKTQEARVLSFIATSGLDIPVPKLVCFGTCEDGTGVIETERIEGATLHSIWRDLSEDEKHSYALQLHEIVKQLRSLEGTYIGGPDQGLAVDPRRDKHYGGPFFSMEEFNEFLFSNTISTTPKIYRKMLQDLLSNTAAQYKKIVFSHGDLSPYNIIVKDGRITGIVDWEFGGWYPEYWEFLQFFRCVYRDYRDYADVIFDTLYPNQLMADHFLGHLTRH